MKDKPLSESDQTFIDGSWIRYVTSTPHGTRELARAFEAATSAADWLCECAPGTDQRERGDTLRAAIATIVPSAAQRPNERSRAPRNVPVTVGRLRDAARALVRALEERRAYLPNDYASLFMDAPDFDRAFNEMKQIVETKA